MNEILPILGLLAFIALLGAVAYVTGKVVDPIGARLDRWVTRRFAKRPSDEPRERQ